MVESRGITPVGTEFSGIWNVHWNWGKEVLSEGAGWVLREWCTVLEEPGVRTGLPCCPAPPAVPWDLPGVKQPGEQWKEQLCLQVGQLYKSPVSWKSTVSMVRNPGILPRNASQRQSQQSVCTALLDILDRAPHRRNRVRISPHTSERTGSNSGLVSYLNDSLVSQKVLLGVNKRNQACFCNLMPQASSAASVKWKHPLGLHRGSLCEWGFYTAVVRMRLKFLYLLKTWLKCCL